MNYWCGDVLYCVVVINCAFKKKKLKQWKISGTKWVICQLNWPCEEVFFPYISHVILLTDAYTPYSFSHPKVTTFCSFLFFSLFLPLVSVSFIFCFFSFLFLRFFSFAWTSEPSDFRWCKSIVGASIFK